MGRPPGSRNRPQEDMQNVANALPSNAVTIMPPVPKSVIGDMANRFGMEPQAFEAALRATVVPKDVSPAQFAAFLMVAKEYNLNPLTKEIYAFPSRGGGIVPIVSVDGWVNLVNSQGQCDGFEFAMDENGERLISCTCTMYRKDRKHPVVVTEYFSECARSTEPWKMKHRMLRHKAFIQAARYAFGFSGIYDEDEGQKIAEIDPNKDAAPPRTIAPPVTAEDSPPRSTAPEPGPGEHHTAGEVQDATPPRRTAAPSEPKKDDPITTGPQPRAAAPAPRTKEVTPFKISGTGETFESWAEKYVDNIKTSPDTATVYKWIDVNSDPLGRLAKGKPSVYATVKKESERVMEQLRDAQAKVQARAAAKAQSTAANEMDETTADELTGGMDDDGPDYGKPADDNPETILRWIEDTLATVDAPEDLENIWVEHCEPKILDMFPPDKEEAQGIYRRHEKRLEP